MIIGNGVIAKNLIDRPDVIFFASGVSNSSEHREEEFQREFNLLVKTIDKYKNLQLIYFSTVRLENTKVTPYLNHKLKLENYIKKHCKKYLILRLGNVFIKGGNPLNLINFLIEKINKQESFLVWKNAERYLTFKEDLKKLSKPLPLNKIIHLYSGKRFTIFEIIEMVENKLGKKAIYKIV